MNQFDNTPVMGAGAPGPMGWLQTWIKAVSQPNEQAFWEITESPEAQPKTAYIWVFIAGTLTYIAVAIVQAIGMALVGGDAQSMGFGFVIGLLCAAPFVGGLGVLFFALGAAIIQWIAKMFGGTGSYDKLVYGMAAIYVPASAVSALLTLVGAIPFVGICTGVLGIGVSFYSIFLNITAVKAVNRFGWGQAAGSVLLPGVVILFFCGCIVAIGLALMGPAIGDIFNGINQSLQFTP